MRVSIASNPAAEAGRRAAEALGRIAPHQIYTLIAGVFGLLFVFVTPPSGAGDEPRHFERMVEVATGRWLGKSGAPAGVIAFVDEAKSTVENAEGFSAERRAELASIPLEADRIEPYPRPLEIILRIHHPVAYLPYAPAVWTGLILDLPPARIFTLCKLTTLIVTLLIMRQAIRLTPQSHRRLAAGLALLPTPVFYLGAANFDAFVSAAGFLFFALIARACLRASEPMRWREAALIGLAALAFATLKTPYALAPLVAVLVPGARFSSVGRRIAFLCALIVPGLVSAGVWALIVKHAVVGGLAYSTPAGAHVEPDAQMALLLEQPLRYLAAIMHTLTETPLAPMSLMQMIGLLGWNNVLMPTWAYALAFLSVCVLWASAGPVVRPLAGARAKVAQVALFALIVTTALFFLYLQWTGVGARHIEGFQGRYLLPIMPLLFSLGGETPRRALGPAAQNAILIASPVACLAASVAAVAAFYYP